MPAANVGQIRRARHDVVHAKIPNDTASIYCALGGEPIYGTPKQKVTFRRRERWSSTVARHQGQVGGTLVAPSERRGATIMTGHRTSPYEGGRTIMTTLMSRRTPGRVISLDM